MLDSKSVLKLEEYYCEILLYYDIQCVWYRTKHGTLVRKS